MFGEAGKGLPPEAGVEDHAIRVCRPGDLRVEFDCMTVVVFAFGEGLFGLLSLSDVHDGHGDADDLVDLVAGGLIGDEVRRVLAGMMRVRKMELKADLGFAIECAFEIRLTLQELRWKDFGEVSAEVGGDGKAVHLGKALIYADVTQVAIEEAETNRGAIVDGIVLSQPQRGRLLQTGD